VQLPDDELASVQIFIKNSRFFKVERGERREERGERREERGELEGVI